MAFSDPQTLTINSIAKVCARVQTNGTKTVYSTADEEVKFTVSHQESKGRTRRMVRVDQRVIAADPLTAKNEYKSTGIYLVIDEPEYGFSDAAIDYVVQALKTWLSTANVLKVLGSEH
jgi:hypothetical protein